MSFIAEAALSASFEWLLEKTLASAELWSFAREKKVDGEIKNWEKMLTRIRVVLDDAEEKQLTDKLVKLWLTDLQDLAYDVEDILDEFATESLKRKIEKQHQGSTSKVQKLIPSCFTSCATPIAASKFNSKMTVKIKEVSNRLEEISGRKNALDLRENNVERQSRKAWQRPASTCLLDEHQVYGRDEDRKKIVELLLRDETSDARVGVVPIVGMGGVGKTTLARLVYNDEALQQFQLKAWVHVSDRFDILRISKSILESITMEPCDLKELNQVQLKLQNQLKEKKYLIVLDDYWNENYGDWIALRSPFMSGASGCRILVTTRNTTVARKMGTVKYCHKLQKISDDDCWSLFAKHALENASDFTHPDMEMIRENVMIKCSGLPLAARTLGGLLRAKHVDEWEDLLNSSIWSLKDDQNGILPVLRLSYYHLPSSLKRCFAYCSLFPKGYKFDETELIQLWMAEGLIQPLDDERDIEDVGAEYFQELFSRSLFEAIIDDECFFTMHDLVHDLAVSVAGETHVKLEEDEVVAEQSNKNRTRHLSYYRSIFDGNERFQHIRRLRCLRTFLPLPPCKPTSYLSNDVPLNIVPKLERLRVLSFSHYNIIELPDMIGNLKHLRYLDLSCTKIRSLPESVTSIYNLQTLLLEKCSHLKKLPERMGNLINLQHLNISGVDLVGGMPMGIKELKNLRMLPCFPVGEENGGFDITALANFKFLRGELHITRLENVINAQNAREANLMAKQGLDFLFLEWKIDYKRNDRFDKDVLDELKPHKKLKRLSIKGYNGTEFSSWIGDPSYCRLVSLRLEKCLKCISLPKLSLLPSLKDLIVQQMWSVKMIDQEFHGESNTNTFPKLETLQFVEMPVLEEWNSCEVSFPCLRELTIKDCYRLSGNLPARLPSLKRLVIRDCYKLVVVLPSLPMLSKLEIRGCQEVDCTDINDFGSPTSVVLHEISNFKSLTESFLEKAKTLSISGYLYLSSQKITSDVVDKKDKGTLQKEQAASSQLEIMKLTDCESLLRWSLNLMSLRLLIIEGCHKLDSFPDVGFPPMLNDFRISRCSSLARLPDAAAYSSNSSLEIMIIEDCESLVSLERCQLPPSLKWLDIKCCDNLQSFLEVESSSFSPFNLEYLSIHHCPSLMSLSAATRLLVKLQRLEIISCSKLESIAESFGNNTSLERLNISYCENLKSLPGDLHKLTNLKKISIGSCSSLFSFPCEGLPTTLKKLEANFCEKLESLPKNIHNLTSLRALVIREMASNPGIISFPEEGFPTNLTTLHVSNSSICKSLFERGLHKFTTLKYLHVQGRCMDVESFPSVETRMTLPSTLTCLYIASFPNLQHLSANGFQNLASLELLSIEDCPKLVSFPKNGLPPSLLQLYINKCPALKESCKKNKGKEWFKIAHIPCVKIDSRSVFKPENEPDEIDSDFEEDEMSRNPEEDATEDEFEEDYETDSDSEDEY